MLPAVVDHQQASGGAPCSQVAQPFLQASGVDPCSVERDGEPSALAGSADCCASLASLPGLTPRGLHVRAGSWLYKLGSRSAGQRPAPPPVYMASQEHQPNTSREAGASFSQRGRAEPAGREHEIESVALCHRGGCCPCVRTPLALGAYPTCCCPLPCNAWAGHRLRASPPDRRAVAVTPRSSSSKGSVPAAAYSTPVCRGSPVCRHQKGRCARLIGRE